MSLFSLDTETTKLGDKGTNRLLYPIKKKQNKRKQTVLKFGKSPETTEQGDNGTNRLLQPIKKKQRKQSKTKTETSTKTTTTTTTKQNKRQQTVLKFGQRTVGSQ